MSVITLLLAEPQCMVRDGLRHTLENRGDLVVVAEAASADQAIEAAIEHCPCIAIVDASLPNTGGFSCCQQILALNKGIEVVVLASADLDYLLFEAWAVGAAGFIPKSATIDSLVFAIRQAVEGKRLFTPSQLRRIQLWQQEVNSQLRKFTNRECEVISLIVRSYTNRRIADELIISEKAVEFHVSRILAKMGVGSRHDITAWIQRVGLESIPIQHVNSRPCTVSW